MNDNRRLFLDLSLDLPEGLERDDITIATIAHLIATLAVLHQVRGISLEDTVSAVGLGLRAAWPDPVAFNDGIVETLAARALEPAGSA